MTLKIPPKTPIGQILPFKPIRQEAVLSKLPIHNLAKKGSVKIHISRQTKEGEIDLLWRVSPSRDHGEPRQLAYKLDTLLINRRLEEQPRPLPRTIRLGSLSQMSRDLGHTHAGKNKRLIKAALHQNAGAYIPANLSYKGKDKSEKHLEAGFTRYSVIFTGERLPNGKSADAVYIVLNEPFWEVLNNAPTRPLNYDYLKLLPPAAQRFYEIISYQIFAALKFNNPSAKILYSKYSTYSAQSRFLKLWQVKRQMGKIHRHHLESGYLDEVSYEQAPDDAEGLPDWAIHYVPGEKARAEYNTFTGKKLSRPTPAPEDAAQQHSATQPPPPTEQGTASNPLITRLEKWGFTAQDAAALLDQLPETQPVAEQLEFLEQEIARQGTGVSGIRSPAGFIRDRLLRNTPVPEHFQSSHKRQAQEQDAEARQAAYKEQRREYDQYLRALAVEHVEKNHLQDEYETHLLAKVDSLRRYLGDRRPEEEILKIAHESVRDEIAKDLPHCKTFEQWQTDQQQPVSATA